VLDVAVKELGDSVDLRLARARVWAAMNVKDLSSKLTDLATKTESLSPSVTTSAAAVAQKRRLLRGLAEIASASGAEEAAGRLWDQLATAKPHDLGVLLIRFDRAARAENIESMKSILPEIVRHQGENGREARLAGATVLVQESQKT
jgi:hypothetical protein